MAIAPLPNIYKSLYFDGEKSADYGVQILGEGSVVDRQVGCIADRTDRVVNFLSVLCGTHVQCPLLSFSISPTKQIGELDSSGILPYSMPAV